jgi:hypothetical protein
MIAVAHDTYDRTERTGQLVQRTGQDSRGRKAGTANADKTTRKDSLERISGTSGGHPGVEKLFISSKFSVVSVCFGWFSVLSFISNHRNSLFRY